DDHLGLFGDRFQRVADDGARLLDRGRAGALAVDVELMPALCEVEGHRMPHDPQTDKTDLHVSYASSRLWLFHIRLKSVPNGDDTGISRCLVVSSNLMLIYGYN